MFQIVNNMVHDDMVHDDMVHDDMVHDDMVHDGRKKVPLNIAILQSIHDKCHSEQFIQIFNRLALCISYDELERIDCSLANEIVNSCIENKVPLSLTITPGLSLLLNTVTY